MLLPFKDLQFSLPLGPFSNMSYTGFVFTTAHIQAKLALA